MVDGRASVEEEIGARLGLSGQTLQFPATGFVDLDQILQFIPVGRTTFFKRVTLGIYPQPIKHGGKNMWAAEAILRLFDEIRVGKCVPDCKTDVRTKSLNGRSPKSSNSSMAL